MTEEWRIDYNNQRPHKALRYMTPVEYRQLCDRLELKRAALYGTALSTPASGNPLQIEAQPVVDNAADKQSISNQSSTFEVTENKGRLQL